MLQVPPRRGAPHGLAGRAEVAIPFASLWNPDYVAPGTLANLNYTPAIQKILHTVDLVAISTKEDGFEKEAKQELLRNLGDSDLHRFP